MNNLRNIDIKRFDYELPFDRIPQYPVSERDASKLLLSNKGNLSEHLFSELTDLLPPTNLLVFNESKVIRARLLFKKQSGAKIEIFCLEPHEPADYYQNFQSDSVCRWRCLVGNSKRWKSDILDYEFVQNIRVSAERIERCDTYDIIEFRWADPTFSFADILEKAGNIPIPPYLNRDSEESDTDRYQTIYSKALGSVAAPTAGLHFTQTVLQKLKSNGTNFQFISLHVGAGTFKPVSSDSISEHRMHKEHFTVKLETIEALVKHCGQVVAVGTTTVRTLESLFYIGSKLLDGNTQTAFDIEQWLPYKLDNEYTSEQCLNAILAYMRSNSLQQLQASTSIMILPGYEFRIVNKLITNFHQPKSTLLLLVAAFVGEATQKEIYSFALENNFRFLSYGDSSLLIP